MAVTFTRFALESSRLVPPGPLISESLHSMGSSGRVVKYKSLLGAGGGAAEGASRERVEELHHSGCVTSACGGEGVQVASA